MKRFKWLIVSGIILAICSLSIFSGSAVQAAPSEIPFLASLVPGFSYQGYLEDGGAPANGTYDMRFGLWDDSSEGNLIALEYKLEVSVDDGLFAVNLEFSGLIVDDTALWLEVEVKGPGDPDYTALSPRQAITAVLYAHYAEQAESAEYVLNIPNHDHWGESWTGSGTGLSLTSSDQHGLEGTASADNSSGVYGLTNWDGGYWAWPPSAGVFGEATGMNGVGVAGKAPGNGVIGYATDWGSGVRGTADEGTGVSGWGKFSGVEGESSDEYGHGVIGYVSHTTGQNKGVLGKTDSPDGTAGMFWNTADSYGSFGSALRTINMTGAGDAIRAETWTETTPDNYDVVEIFTVENDGDVYAAGTFNPGGADFAEMLPGAAGLEAGDVLAIDPSGELVRSTAAYQTTVMGVYSTQPGFLGGAGEGSDLIGKIPLAVVGVVPVKASAENGAIHPGDLLVAADTPGHAMRAGENPPVGTVLGKALGTLEEGLGLVQILVILQ